MFILLTTIHFCEPAEYSFREGETADLRFLFQFTRDVEIVLQLEEREPFFKNWRINEKGLSDSQVGRFEVRMIPIQHYHFQAQIIIKNISRDDAGKYSCFVYDGDKYLEDMTTYFDVFVEFLPDKLSCTLARHKDHQRIYLGTIERIWKLLNCSMPAGSDHSFIVCYQNREILPIMTSSGNEQMTVATIWMRPKMPVHCCSRSEVNVEDMCDCDDFVWFPLALSKEKRIYTPCAHEGEDTHEEPNPTESIEYGATVRINKRIFCLIVSFTIFLVFAITLAMTVLKVKYTIKRRERRKGNLKDNEEVNDEPKESNETGTESIEQRITIVEREDHEQKSQSKLKDSEEEVNDKAMEANATATELIKQVKTTVKRENPKLNSHGNFKDTEEEEVNDEPKESNETATEFIGQRISTTGRP